MRRRADAGVVERHKTLTLMATATALPDCADVETAFAAAERRMAARFHNIRLGHRQRLTLWICCKADGRRSAWPARFPLLTGFIKSLGQNSVGVDGFLSYGRIYARTKERGRKTKRFIPLRAAGGSRNGGRWRRRAACLKLAPLRTTVRQHALRNDRWRWGTLSSRVAGGSV